MKAKDGVIVALLVVLILIVVCRTNAFPLPAKLKGCGLKQKEPAREGLVGSRGAYTGTNPSEAPYTAIQNSIGLVRGNPDATEIIRRGGAARWKAFTRSKAELKPEDLMAAERASWATAAEEDRRAPFDTEKMTNSADDTMQHFESSPAIDYDNMIQDLVVDSRTRENHRQWVDEMKGWSGTTTMKVDILEPELYLNWTGLRMPQAGVGQYNPLQLTEVDDADLAKNKDFRFNG